MPWPRGLLIAGIAGGGVRVEVLGSSAPARASTGTVNGAVTRH